MKKESFKVFLKEIRIGKDNFPYENKINSKEYEKYKHGCYDDRGIIWLPKWDINAFLHELKHANFTYYDKKHNRTINPEKSVTDSLTNWYREFKCHWFSISRSCNYKSKYFWMNLGMFLAGVITIINIGVIMSFGIVRIVRILLDYFGM